jgi:hypothetical protein
MISRVLLWETKPPPPPTLLPPRPCLRHSHGRHVGLLPPFFPPVLQPGRVGKGRVSGEDWGRVMKGKVSGEEWRSGRTWMQRFGLMINKVRFSGDYWGNVRKGRVLGYKWRPGRTGMHRLGLRFKKVRVSCHYWGHDRSGLHGFSLGRKVRKDKVCYRTNC